LCVAAGRESTASNGSGESNSIWYLIKDAIKDLVRLAEEGLAILRAEVQVACFYHLHQFSHLKLGTGISQEPEGIILALYQHLLAFQDAVLAALDTEALAVIFSPLCTIIPRLLLRYLQHIALSSSEVTESYSLDGNISMADQIHHDKTHILRAMVACQQSMSMLIESSKFDALSNKLLQDVITEEFERVRRYVTLMDMPMLELKQYLSNNMKEYTYEEYSALWTQLKDRPPDLTFNKVWSSLVSRTSPMNTGQDGRNKDRDRDRDLDSRDRGHREGRDRDVDSRDRGYREGRDRDVDSRVRGHREGRDLDVDSRVRGHREGRDRDVDSRDRDVDSRDRDVDSRDRDVDSRVRGHREGRDRDVDSRDRGYREGRDHDVDSRDRGYREGRDREFRGNYHR